MLDRCTNSKHVAYEYYGGRGIRPCEHLRNFEAFFAYLGERPPGMTLDRKNNDLGYLCPLCLPPDGNCRWATRILQGRNRSYTKLDISKAREIRKLAAAGTLQSELAAQFGVSERTLHDVLRERIWKEAA